MAKTTENAVAVSRDTILDMETEIGRAAGILSGVVTGLRYASPTIAQGASDAERERVEDDAWFLGVLKGAIEEQIHALKAQEAALFALRAPGRRNGGA